jgi:hypothetical protein
VFEENRYFDLFVEYAKVSAEDILIRLPPATADQFKRNPRLQERSEA